MAPSEITHIAYNSGSVFLSPCFPNEGLTIYQIVNVLHNLGYEVTTVDVSEYNQMFIENLIKAFLAYGLPLIATLNVIDEKRKETKHAAVISGYRINPETQEIMKLYVHDDQIGPYSRVKFSKRDIYLWENEWVENRGYKEVKLERLIIPLYHKIRMNYTYLYNKYFEDLLINIKDKKNVSSFLSDVVEYKKDILYRTMHQTNSEIRSEILETQLPHYFWIIRIQTNNELNLDMLFDATQEKSHGPRLFRF